MILLNYPNWKIKLTILIGILSCILLITLTQQSQSKTTTHPQQTTIQKTPIQNPKSMAHFNPKTGSFTPQALPITQPKNKQFHYFQTSSTTEQSLKINTKNTHQDKTQNKKNQPKASFEQYKFERYKNSLVIPAPRSLHSTLVAYKPSQADINAGANTILIQHAPVQHTQHQKYTKNTHPQSNKLSP